MRNITLALALLLGACARQLPPAAAPAPVHFSISAPCRPLPYALGGRPANLRPPVPPSMESGMRRIDSLTSLVDTIMVHPESLTIHVGQSVDIRQGQNWEGRRANGERVPTFGAWLDVEDRTVLRSDESGFTGLRAGLTRIIISAFSTSPGLDAHAPASCIMISVVP